MWLTPQMLEGSTAWVNLGRLHAGAREHAGKGCLQAQVCGAPVPRPAHVATPQHPQPFRRHGLAPHALQYVLQHAGSPAARLGPNRCA